MIDLMPGDDMAALHDGGRDPDGLPVQAPVAGQRYKLTGIYRAPYGLGCTLLNMDPYPYRGYFLFITKNQWVRQRNLRPGWYFRKLVQDTEASDGWFAAEFLKQLHGAGP